MSDPELFKQWMGTGPVLDATHVTVHYPTGQTARGTLRESTPNERIVFGWGYDAPDTSTVTIANVMQSNGVIHVIDSVVLPN